MADYGIKYRISYYRKSGRQTTIDILERDHAESAITELTACGNPLEIAFEGNINNIYKPTIGSGESIRVISQPLLLLTTPFTLIDLFTEDPQKFIVKIYDGVSDDDSDASSDLGGTLVWQGFISPQIYNKSYSSPLPSPITLNCNDGMAVLDNLSYSVTEGGTKYTGLATIATVMSNIFNKLGISFNNIRTSCDLLVATGVTNIFTGLTVNNDNYYDEKGEAMSCREVLDSIFGGLGLIMSFKGDTVYLIDPINLHNTANGKSYTMHPDFVFTESVVALGGYLDISAGEITWYETGGELDVVKPFNQIEIKYDPYNFTEYTYDFNDEDNWSADGTFLCEHEGAGTVTTDETTILVGDGTSFLDYKVGDSVVVNGETARIITAINTDTNLEVDTVFLTSDSGLSYRIGAYFLNSTITFENITSTAGFSSFAGVKETNISDAEYFIALYDSDGTITISIPFSTIKQDNNLKLRLSMDVWVQTKENNVNIFSDEDPGEGVNINQYRLPVSLMIGTQYWKNWNFWGTEETGLWIWPFLVQKRTMTTLELNTELLETKINNCWTTSSIDIPLEASGTITPLLISGSITVKILDTIREWMVGQVHPNTYRDNVHFILIKNVKVEFIDAITGKSIGNDGVLTTSVMDEATYRNKTPLNINLTNGTGTYGISKGAFSSDNASPIGVNITGLKRSDDNPSTLKKTTDLLSQSLLSQYNQSKFKITGKLNVIDYLLNTNMKLVKDSTHLGTKAFYIVNGTYNDREESMEVEMIEITSTRETIT